MRSVLLLLRVLLRLATLAEGLLAQPVVELQVAAHLGARAEALALAVDEVGVGGAGRVARRADVLRRRVRGNCTFL